MLRSKTATAYRKDNWLGQVLHTYDSTEKFVNFLFSILLFYNWIMKAKINPSIDVMGETFFCLIYAELELFNRFNLQKDSIRCIKIYFEVWHRQFDSLINPSKLKYCFVNISFTIEYEHVEPFHPNFCFAVIWRAIPLQPQKC